MATVVGALLGHTGNKTEPTWGLVQARGRQADTPQGGQQRGRPREEALLSRGGGTVQATAWCVKGCGWRDQAARIPGHRKLKGEAARAESSSSLNTFSQDQLSKASDLNTNEKSHWHLSGVWR